MYHYAAASIIILLLLLWAFWDFWKRLSEKSSLKIPGRVLLIIAHPDDECMFFSPTILTLTRTAPHNVYLLCLSEGN